jgi:hypothetical protein
VKNVWTTQISPSNQCDSHFANVNYSQLFRVKNACGEQVLFVILLKNHARQENFVAARRQIAALRSADGSSACCLVFELAGEPPALLQLSNAASAVGATYL